MSDADARTTTTGWTATRASAAGPDGAAAPDAEELPRGTTVNRYVIIDAMGRGGMGTVYSAWDPDLGRRVALKLLRRHRAGSGVDPILTEARALARLAHPNIVTVHDVGTFEGQAFVTLEFLDQPTLRQWLRSAPPLQQRIAVLEQCARALAAAHRAGLAHGDFKPDNVLVDAVAIPPIARVIDFGLARLGTAAASSPEDGPAIAGTRSYMAREVLLGAPPDPRSDQFSFALSAVEILTERRPSRAELERDPAQGTGMLRPVLSPALALDPRERWPSMDALLQAIGRVRARRRYRRFALGLGVLAALGVGTQALERRDLAACAEAGAAIEAVWNDDVEHRVRTALLEVGSSYADATATRTAAWLDDHASRWRAARTEACLRVAVERTWSDTQFERARWCLDDRGRDFRSTVEQLGEADEVVLQHAVTLTSRLAAPETCLDPAVLASLPDPPDEASRADVATLRSELGRASALLNAAKYDDGLRIAETAPERAEALGWSPLLADALFFRGSLRRLAGRLDEAERDLIDAYVVGAKANNWRCSAGAAQELIVFYGQSATRRHEGRGWAVHAELAAHLAGDPLRLFEAQRLHNLAEIDRHEGAPADALVLSRREFEIYRTELGPDHPRTAMAENEIAIELEDLGRYAEAEAAFASALPRLEQALGDGHPFVALGRSNLSSLYSDLGQHERAVELAMRAVQDMQRAFGDDHPWVGALWINVGATHSHLRHYEEARDAFARAKTVLEKIHGTEHPMVATCMDNLASMHAELGDYEQAAVLHERALGIRERVLGPEHPDVSISLVNIGVLDAERGRYERGRAALERALALTEKVQGLDHPAVGETLVSLAEVELEAGQRARARELATRALRIFEQHEGDQPYEPEARTILARTTP